VSLKSEERFSGSSLCVIKYCRFVVMEGFVDMQRKNLIPPGNRKNTVAYYLVNYIYNFPKHEYIFWIDIVEFMVQDCKTIPETVFIYNLHS
jgi:hypothetical protein